MLLWTHRCSAPMGRRQQQGLTEDLPDPQREQVVQRSANGLHPAWLWALQLLPSQPMGCFGGCTWQQGILLSMGGSCDPSQDGNHGFPVPEAAQITLWRVGMAILQAVLQGWRCRQCTLLDRTPRLKVLSERGKHFSGASLRWAELPPERRLVCQLTDLPQNRARVPCHKKKCSRILHPNPVETGDEKKKRIKDK